MTARDDIYTDIVIIIWYLPDTEYVVGTCDNNNRNNVMDEQSANLSKSLRAMISVDCKTRHDGVVEIQKYIWCLYNISIYGKHIAWLRSL